MWKKAFFVPYFWFFSKYYITTFLQNISTSLKCIYWGVNHGHDDSIPEDVIKGVNHGHDDSISEDVIKGDEQSARINTHGTQRWDQQRTM